MNAVNINERDFRYCPPERESTPKAPDPCKWGITYLFSRGVAEVQFKQLRGIPAEMYRTHAQNRQEFETNI